MIVLYDTISMSESCIQQIMEKTYGPGTELGSWEAYLRVDVSAPKPTRQVIKFVRRACETRDIVAEMWCVNDRWHGRVAAIFPGSISQKIHSQFPYTVRAQIDKFLSRYGFKLK